MGGYGYRDPEPKQRCPHCNALCCADFVDVGVGMVQCGPFHCEACGASEIGPNDEPRPLTEQESKTGWYAPGQPAGSSANTDEQGRVIRHFEADTLYRARHGVPPRYDKHGRLIGLLYRKD